jgi:protein gp37
MALNSSIEWCHHTVSFWWGCEKISPACKNCYAEEIDRRFGPKRDFGNRHWGPHAPRLDQRAIAETLLHDITRKERKKNQLPSRVFINSMSDWLDPAVPAEWLADLLSTLARFPNLNHLLLSKRPQLWRERMEAVAALNGPGGDIAHAWLAGYTLPNFWIGTTVEDQQRADERIPALLNIPAAIRFLSCEPLLEHVDIFGEDGAIEKAEQAGLLDDIPFDRNNPYRLHWIIAGGESGAKARPSHPNWFRSLRDQCDRAGVPFFFKQWGSWGPTMHGGDGSR